MSSPIDIIQVFCLYTPTENHLIEEVKSWAKDLENAIEGTRIQWAWMPTSTDNETSYFENYLRYSDVIWLLVSKELLKSEIYLSDAIQDLCFKNKSHEKQVLSLIMNECYWQHTRLESTHVIAPGNQALEKHLENQEFKALIKSELLSFFRKVRNTQHLNTQRFYKLTTEANALFSDWQSNVLILQEVKDLYLQAKPLYKPGMLPDEETISAHLAVCERELDFNYYKNAAQNALKLEDYQGVLYHAKDALALRNDGLMLQLIAEATTKINNQRKALKKTPFNAHIQTADFFFVNMEWLLAAKEYAVALDFFEKGFKPEKDSLSYKIEICERELLWKQQLRQAKKQLKIYNFEGALTLLRAAYSVHPQEAKNMVADIQQKLERLMNIERFQDSFSTLWGFWDKRNQIVLIPAQFEEAHNFSSNFAAVRKGQLWGYIDIEGQLVVPYQYQFAGHFEGNKAKVINQNAEELEIVI